MNIEFNSGKPDRDGDYVTVNRYGGVSELSFTVEHGWNTSKTSWGYALKDDDIVAWCETFGKYVVDIYGHFVIMKEEKGNED